MGTVITKTYFREKQLPDRRVWKYAAFDSIGYHLWIKFVELVHDGGVALLSLLPPRLRPVPHQLLQARLGNIIYLGQRESEKRKEYRTVCRICTYHLRGL
jgi:hypothetical protein